MTNVNDIMLDFDALINYAQQGNITPEVRNIFMNNAVESLYKQRLGLPEQYDMATSVSNIAYARTKKIHVDLLPYRKREKIIISDAEFIPVADLPEDLYYETGVKYYTVVKMDDGKSIAELNRCKCSPVADEVATPEYKKFVGTMELVEEDKWASRVNSTIIKKAIYLSFNEGWKLNFPIKKPSYIEIEYLKRPTKAIWAFTVVNDVEVYDAANSVNVEFDDMLRGEIVARMVKEYGKYTDDPNSVQYGQNNINSGS